MNSSKLTRKELATFLSGQGYPITAGTLAVYASKGGGPPYYKFGHQCMYDDFKALAWARNRAPERTSTSQVA